MTIEEYIEVANLATDKVDDVAELLDDEKLGAYCEIIKDLECWASWLMGYYTALNTLGIYVDENVAEFKKYREEAEDFAIALLTALKELDLI